MKRILILDDEESITFSLSRFLQSEEVQVIGFNDAQSAKHAIAWHAVDAIITDVRLSVLNPHEAIDFVHFVRSRNPQVPVIMMSCTEDLKAESIREGANYFFQKPVDLDELVAVLRRYGLEIKRRYNYKEVVDFCFYPEVYGLIEVPRRFSPSGGRPVS